MTVRGKFQRTRKFPVLNGSHLRCKLLKRFPSTLKYFTNNEPKPVDTSAHGKTYKIKLSPSLKHESYIYIYIKLII